MRANMTQRDQRIDLRVSADLKTLLSRAAAYSGMSLSSFLVAVASDHAKQVVGEHETVTLSSRDWKAFRLPSTKPTSLVRDWKPPLVATVNAA